MKEKILIQIEKISKKNNYMLDSRKEHNKIPKTDYFQFKLELDRAYLKDLRDVLNSTKPYKYKQNRIKQIGTNYLRKEDFLKDKFKNTYDNWILYQEEAILLQWYISAYLVPINW